MPFLPARSKSTRTLKTVFFLLLLATVPFLGYTPARSAPVRSLADTACALGCATIQGQPLTIKVAKDASYQVLHSGASSATRGMVYHYSENEGDAGIFVRYNDTLIQPDFWNHLTSAVPVQVPPGSAYNAWMNVSQSGVSGAGTAASPWNVETKVTHPASGVNLATRTSYINGNNYFRIDWDICLPSAGSVSTFLAADLFLQGGLYSDPMVGISDNGTVGGVNPSLEWLQTFTPLTPNSRYYADSAKEVWDAIGTEGTPGPGFNNTINSTPLDGGAGLQWDLSMSSCTTVSATWNFASSPRFIYLPYLFR